MLVEIINTVVRDDNSVGRIVDRHTSTGDSGRLNDDCDTIQLGLGHRLRSTMNEVTGSTT